MNGWKCPRDCEGGGAVIKRKDCLCVNAFSLSDPPVVLWIVVGSCFVVDLCGITCAGCVSVRGFTGIYLSLGMCVPFVCQRAVLILY